MVMAYNHGLEFEGNDKHYGNDYDLPEDTSLAATDGLSQDYLKMIRWKVIQISR